MDHKILLQRLQSHFGDIGRALALIRSYFHQRTQYVRLGSRRSRPRPAFSGVPQGSVLGTILFLIYTADLPCVIQRLSDCIYDVANWMRSNRLLLNTEKTEALWCLSNRHQHLLPSDPVRVGFDYVKPSFSVRDLG